jgi:hypothetical protein
VEVGGKMMKPGKAEELAGATTGKWKESLRTVLGSSGPSVTMTKALAFYNI